MKKNKISRTKHAAQRRKPRKQATRNRARATTTAVIPIAVKTGGRLATESATIPVAVENGPKSIESAVIPIAVENRPKSPKSKKSRRSRGSKGQQTINIAVIPVAVKAKPHMARRKRAVRQEPRQTNLPSQSILQRGVGEAIEFEKAVVDVAGGIGLLTIDVLQTAATLAVHTPAALLGTRPALPASRERSRVAPQYSAVPALPMAA